MEENLLKQNPLCLNRVLSRQSGGSITSVLDIFLSIFKPIYLTLI